MNTSRSFQLHIITTAEEPGCGRQVVSSSLDPRVFNRGDRTRRAERKLERDPHIATEEPPDPPDGLVKSPALGINAAGQHGTELNSRGTPAENHEPNDPSRLKAGCLAAGNPSDNLCRSWIRELEAEGAG